MLVYLQLEFLLLIDESAFVVKVILVFLLRPVMEELTQNSEVFGIQGKVFHAYLGADTTLLGG